MANRIKGLTVEIDGSTTGLDKALKNVNTTIKGTQTQLKDVQKLLKLDPSNTELLSQKQRLLKEAIGATKDKLDSLKTANASGRHGKYVIGETEYSVNFTNGTVVVEFKLKGGEQAVFSEIQKNATFTLEELSADQNGYVTSVTSTGGTIEGKKVTGTFSNETAITATYVNSKQSVTLDILKVEKNGTKKLENAVFELNQIEADKTTISTISGTTQTATTNDQGKAQFPNLTNGFYEIVEKNPPAGYVLTENAKFYIEVTDDGINLVTRVDNTKPSEWTTKNAVYGIVKDFAVATDIANAKATIENEPGAALPNTGGPGTWISILLGGALSILAIFLLRKRKLKPLWKH